MAAVFKIDSFDLSAHLRVNQGDGLDPYDQGGFLDPQFADGALSDGDPLISIREGNREQQWAVILNPARAGYTASKDGLHQLIRDVNRALRSASQVEWRDDGATSSTFFDVQFARFDPAWDFRRSQKLWVPGVIKAWTRPYGHTGTSRVVATAAGSQAAARLSIASGTLDGDAGAEVTGVISLATNAQHTHLVGFAIGAPSPAWQAFWPPASIAGAATVIGASGAFASQAARQVVAVGADVAAVQVSITASSTPGETLRVLALARANAATALASAVAIRGHTGTIDPLEAALGPTQLLPTGRDWRIVDLGTLRGGTSVLRQQSIAIYMGMLSASAGATSTVDFGGVLIIPEAQAVVISQPSTLFTSAVATFAFSTVTRTAVGQLGAYDYRYDSAVRGDYPRIPVGSARDVLAFAIPDDAPHNNPVSVEIRCREKFNYGR